MQPEQPLALVAVQAARKPPTSSRQRRHACPGEQRDQTEAAHRPGVGADEAERPQQRRDQRHRGQPALGTDGGQPGRPAAPADADRRAGCVPRWRTSGRQRVRRRSRQLFGAGPGPDGARWWSCRAAVGAVTRSARRGRPVGADRLGPASSCRTGLTLRASQTRPRWSAEARSMPGRHVPEPGQQHHVLEGELRVGQGDRQVRETRRRTAPGSASACAYGGAELDRLGGQPPVHEIGVGQADRAGVLPVDDPVTAPRPALRPSARPARCPARSRRARQAQLDLAPEQRLGAGAPAAGPGCAASPGRPPQPPQVVERLVDPARPGPRGRRSG